MNIDWAIPCRYLEVHDNLGTIIGAGIDTYWLPELPAPIQVVVAVRLVATADELGPDEQHTARSRILDPDGNPITEDVEGQFSIDVESPREEWLNGVIMPAVFQFEVTREGTYTIEQAVDNAISSLPIHVVQGLPPGMQPPAPEA